MTLESLCLPRAWRFRPAAALLTAAIATSAGAFEPERWLNFATDRFSFRPRLDMSTVYTDNVFFGNNNILNAAGKPLRAKEDEFIQQVSPGFTAQYGLASGNFVRARYGHDEIFYLGNSQFNTSQDRLGADFKLSSPKFTVDGNNDVRLLSGFLNGGFQLGAVQIDRTEYANRLHVGYDLSSKTDLYADFDHFAFDYQKDTPLLDQNSLRGSLGTTYKYSEKLNFFVEGFYGQTATSPNQASAKPPHSVFYGGFVGVRGQFTPKIEGSLKTGYEQRDFAGSAVSSSAPAVVASLSYAPFPQTSIAVQYQRSTGVAFQFVQQSFIYDTLNVSLVQLLGTSRIWSVEGGLRYVLADLSGTTELGSNGTSLVYSPRSDTTYEVIGRLRYKPREWLTASIQLSMENYGTDATLSINRGKPQVYLVDYVDHRVTMQLGIGF